VYVTTVVQLDGRVTNVIKVLINVYNILMSYFLYKRYHRNIGIRNDTLETNKTYIVRANNISPRIQGYMLFIFKLLSKY
jgi:hypothetical protein